MSAIVQWLAMLPLFTNLVGYTATVVGTFVMVPQVIKIWRTREVKDLSYIMVILYATNCVLWLTYGFLLGATPVVIANAIGLAVGLVQLVLKWRFERVV